MIELGLMVVALTFQLVGAYQHIFWEDGNESNLYTLALGFLWLSTIAGRML